MINSPHRVNNALRHLLNLNRGFIRSNNMAKWNVPLLTRYPHFAPKVLHSCAFGTRILLSSYSCSLSNLGHKCAERIVFEESTNPCIRCCEHVFLLFSFQPHNWHAQILRQSESFFLYQLSGHRKFLISHFHDSCG
jgi:hypothetical protein